MAFTLQIGQQAPDFTLPGVDGKTYSLADFAHAKVLVVFFTCNHCPYVVGSEERIAAFHNQFHPRGVDMIGINANETEHHPGDDFPGMVKRAKEKGIRYPYVRDESQEAARVFGGLRTPHFYLFDQARKLRYTGRMDDNPREPGKQTTHELVDAVEAVLAGKKPPVEMTNPIGCNVKWKGKEEHWMPPEACDLV